MYLKQYLCHGFVQNLIKHVYLTVLMSWICTKFNSNYDFIKYQYRCHLDNPKMNLIV